MQIQNTNIQLDCYLFIIYIQIQITSRTSMQSNQVIFPFLSTQRNINDDGFFKSLQTRVFPYMKLFSLSTVVIIINILVFILLHVLYRPSSYVSFLELPVQGAKWILDIQLVKSKKSYIYQCFTAMFVHKNYLHILGNMIFAAFVIYQMENSWLWSIPLGLVSGFAANCLAVLTLEGTLEGFSAVLTSYVGMVVILIITHLDYFQSRQRGGFFMMLILVVLLSFMAIGFSGSVVIHLYGYLFGMIIGLGFYPKNSQSCVTPFMDKIFKALAIGLVALVIVLAVLR